MSPFSLCPWSLMTTSVPRNLLGGEPQGGPGYPGCWPGFLCRAPLPCICPPCEQNPWPGARLGLVGSLWVAGGGVGTLSWHPPDPREPEPSRDLGRNAEAAFSSANLRHCFILSSVPRQESSGRPCPSGTQNAAGTQPEGPFCVLCTQTRSKTSYPLDGRRFEKLNQRREAS